MIVFKAVQPLRVNSNLALAILLKTLPWTRARNWQARARAAAIRAANLAPLNEKIILSHLVYVINL